jgi:hypothetical protein
MERSRLDRVRINVQWEIVEIAWAERDWLLRRLIALAGFETIIAKFEAVGASRPVELDFDERARLRGALEFWNQTRELQHGLTRLLAALVQAAPRSEA